MKTVQFSILGVNVSAVNLQKACAVIDQFIQEKKKGYICVAPVATVIDCQDDPEYRAVVNGAALVTPDGMPLVWLAKMLGYKEVKRTYGPDLMLAVCDAGQNKSYRHYFYGATAEVLEHLEKKLLQKFPSLEIAGRYAPPFQKKIEESEEIINGINQSKADILWVGLGSPKQDFWMAKHRGKINASVMIGVGAAFDFLSGTKKQAPRWIQKSGLEWLFRLCCEPRRLWKRYLIGNSRFAWLILRTMIIGQLRHENSKT